MPATVHAVLQNDSMSNGNSAAQLVAFVRERTPAAEHAVSALMYEELTYRLQRLQGLLRMQQDHRGGTSPASDVANLRAALAELPLQRQQQSLLQQKQRVQGDGVPDDADTPSSETSAESSLAKEESSPGQKDQSSQEEQQQLIEKTQREQALKKLQQDQIFLRRYLTLTASQEAIVENPDTEDKPEALARRQFPGIRASRMFSSGSGNSVSKKLAGLPINRVRRDVSTALVRASSTSFFAVNRWMRQAALIRTRGAASETNRHKGYVLADSCVAVDFRGILKGADAGAGADFKEVDAEVNAESAAAASGNGGAAKLDAAVEEAAASVRDAVAATAQAAAITNVAEERYDADCNSCACPSGWAPCSKEEALQVSYGWRQTLEQACAEEQQREEGARTVVRAYTKGLYSFDCDGNELSVRGAKIGPSICRSAPLVLCKEIKPLCGVSEWCDAQNL